MRTASTRKLSRPARGAAAVRPIPIATTIAITIAIKIAITNSYYKYIAITIATTDSYYR